MRASMSTVVRASLVAGSIYVGGVSPVWAQVVQTSLLSGRVFDPSGAVIQQAEVTLRGPFLLDGERETATDDRGRYRFPALLPGTYSLTATAPGFAPVERGDIVIEVGEGRLVDFELPIGATTEQITVAERVPAVDVTASSIPTHLDRELLNHLPVTRELDDLINLAPGVTFNVAFGGTQSSNAIYINGVQATNPQQQFSLIEVNHNWLDQVEVAALGAGAEYGGFTGVAANAVVKSGGNRFSGLGEFWTTRPGWLSDNSPEKPREIISLYETTGQVGGPVMTDRLWFFGGVDYATVENRPALFSGPGSTTNDRRSLIARLDAAMSDDIHLDGLYQYARTDSSGVGLGPVRVLETTNDVTSVNHLWNTRTSWAATSRTLLEARTGGYASVSSTDPRPPNTRLGPPSTLFQGVLSGTSLGFGDSDRSRTDVAVSLTRFQEIAGQSHDLKAGFELETTDTTDRFGFNGGMVLMPVPQRGFTVFNIWSGETDETSSRRGTAYLQDRWSVHDRVTLNIGVRVDLNRASVPVQGTIFSTNPVSPRAGVAWAATADNATVIRAHYGRYHDSTLTRTIRDLDTTDQNDRIIEVGLPSGQRFEVDRIPPEATNATVDDDIGHSYVDQYVVGIERELSPSVSIQVQYVRRQFEQFMGMIDINTEWTARQVRDPGPDGVLSTEDDQGLVTVFRPSTDFSERQFLYTNPPGAFRGYDAVQLIGTKRYADNWQMQASYTWSRSEATVGNDESVNAGRGELSLLPIGGTFISPNGLINDEGEAPWTISELKVLGTYRVPAWGGLNVSGIYRYHSGRRWGRSFLTDDPLPFSVQAEPVGARRLPAVASLDLRIEKTLEVPGTAGRLGLFVDVFNLTNEGSALFVIEHSGSRFGEPITWTDPRTVRAGLRYTF